MNKLVPKFIKFLNRPIMVRFDNKFLSVNIT